VFNAIFATAREGMATQARRVEAAAQKIASLGTSPPASDPQSPSSPPVRIGDLPVGDTIEEAVVTLVEAQRAYRANALVVATAADMYDSLLDAVDHHHHHHHHR
jgi:Flagellar basal body rod FlgEFG protein C-terminal